MKLTRILGTTLVALTAACSETGSGPAGGTQILLTDSPFPFSSVSRVDVHIVRIEATTESDTTGPGNWVTVVSPGRTVNLLDFQGGATTLLGEADLPAGSYQAVRLVINTSLSSITGIDGSEIPVHWSVPGEFAMYALVEDPLAVSGSGGRIVIDFDVGRSFRIMGNGFVFIPFIRAVNDAVTGTISGTVTRGDTDPGTPLPNSVVTVFHGNHLDEDGAIVATARSDAQGQYAVAFLREGTYDIAIDAPYTIEGRIESCLHFSSVSVTSGQVTTINRRLPIFDAACSGPQLPDSGGVDTTVYNPPGGAVDSVAISMNPPTLGVGDSAWAVAVLRDAAGTILSGRAVTWSVSDSAKVLLFAGFGPYVHLRPTATGTVTLYATSEGKTGQRTFTIGAGSGGGGGGGGGGTGTGPVANITMNPAALTPAVNDSVWVTAQLTNAAGQPLTGRSVIFSTSDSSVVLVAGVFGHGANLRAKKVGTATITATSEGKTGIATVSVH